MSDSSYDSTPPSSPAVSSPEPSDDEHAPTPPPPKKASKPRAKAKSTKAKTVPDAKPAPKPKVAKKRAKATDDAPVKPKKARKPKVPKEEAGEKRSKTSGRRRKVYYPPPNRYDDSVENLNAMRLFYQNLADATDKQLQKWIGRERRAEAARRKRPAKVTLDSDTLAKYRNFLDEEATKGALSNLDKKWLSVFGFPAGTKGKDGLITAKHIDKHGVPEHADVRIRAAAELYNAAKRFGLQPRGIISEGTSDPVYEMVPDPKNPGKEKKGRVISSNYLVNPPNGEERIFIGRASHLRSAWEEPHPLGLSQSHYQKSEVPVDQLIGSNEPMSLLKTGKPKEVEA